MPLVYIFIFKKMNTISIFLYYIDAVHAIIIDAILIVIYDGLNIPLKTITCEYAH